MDPEFLEKTNPTFLCLTTVLLCHELHCWQTGLFIEEVDFRHCNSRVKPPVIRVRGENRVIG